MKLRLIRAYLIIVVLLFTQVRASFANEEHCAPTRYHQGRIARSHQAIAEFKRLHPCPSTGRHHGSCPGHIVDHVIPLKRCGADDPSNMQWQTIEDAKEKDRWE